MGNVPSPSFMPRLYRERGYGLAGLGILMGVFVREPTEKLTQKNTLSSVRQLSPNWRMTRSPCRNNRTEPGTMCREQDAEEVDHADEHIVWLVLHGHPPRAGGPLLRLGKRPLDRVRDWFVQYMPGVNARCEFCERGSVEERVGGASREAAKECSPRHKPWGCLESAP
jgi:hypothetical protein